jgi:probable rRNA maturation factor
MRVRTPDPMLDIAVQVEPPWPEGAWEALADRTVSEALGATPHAGLAMGPSMTEISIRLTSDDEVHTLNRDYRGKDQPTNVLSFPMLDAEELSSSTAPELLLGDIVLAHGVCAREAEEKSVTLEAHATHLIVHGMLHLLGYDHQGSAEAEEMESLERGVMARLGLHDPYLRDEPEFDARGFE